MAAASHPWASVPPVSASRLGPPARPPLGGGGGLPAEPWVMLPCQGTLLGKGNSKGPSCDAGLCWWLRTRALLYAMPWQDPALPLFSHSSQGSIHPSAGSLLLLHCLQRGRALASPLGMPLLPSFPISGPLNPTVFYQTSPFISLSSPLQHHHLPPTTSTSLSQPVTAGESQLAPIVLSLGPKLKFMTS